MLTPPKWQTVWLKSQHSSKNHSRVIMYPKPADKILDDLSECCNSVSKDLTLDALNCWKIWIENQELDDWKQNKLCYSAVKPLLTKRFHPLYKDSVVTEIKLSLLWLSLQKVQNFMHLEGPQHILEVFIQSCLSWLSTSEDTGKTIQNLVLKLLCSLFSKDVQIMPESERFPPLSADILLSKKLFSRLLTFFLEIFHNWPKVKEKDDLLFIWDHFMNNCEQSFKFIPVVAWHKIFKVIESICSHESELLKNKIALLHKCAISLKSVMSNSKYIDSSQLLTTPAEALMKMLVDLCIQNADENVSFEIFSCCLEISQVLSSHIINAFGYEPCFYILSKIEEIDTKSLYWGLWCGIVQCFRERVHILEIDQYSQMEIKVFRKLRALGINFDLDKLFLDESSAFLVEELLIALSIGSPCGNCGAYNGGQKKEKEFIDNTNLISIPEEKNSEYHIQCDYGSFGFELCSMIKKTRCVGNKTCTLLGFRCKCPANGKNVSQDSVGGNCYERSCISLTFNFSRSDRSVSHLRNVPRCKILHHSADRKWLRCEFNAQKLNVNKLPYFYELCRSERLITHNFLSGRSVLFAPVYFTVALEELFKNNCKKDYLDEMYTDNIKKVLSKMKDGNIFKPMKLLVSLIGKRGVEFYSHASRFWDLIDDVIYDSDFQKNLNISLGKNGKSLLWLWRFFFILNFLRNLFVECSEKNVHEHMKPNLEDELCTIIFQFMRKVIRSKECLSNSSFLNNLCNILQKDFENPLVLWAEYVRDNSEWCEGQYSAVCFKEQSVSGDLVVKCFENAPRASPENTYFNSSFCNGTSITCSRDKKNTGEYSSDCDDLKVCTLKKTEGESDDNSYVMKPNIFNSDYKVECNKVCNEDIRHSVSDAPKIYRNRKEFRKNAKRNIFSTPQKRSRSWDSSLLNFDCFESSEITNENFDIESITKKRKEETNDDILHCSCREINSDKQFYTLRKRPLKRPSKFQDINGSLEKGNKNRNLTNEVVKSGNRIRCSKCATINKIAQDTLKEQDFNSATMSGKRVDDIVVIPSGSIENVTSTVDNLLVGKKYDLPQIKLEIDAIDNATDYDSLKKMDNEQCVIDIKSENVSNLDIGANKEKLIEIVVKGEIVCQPDEKIENNIQIGLKLDCEKSDIVYAVQVEGFTKCEDERTSCYTSSSTTTANNNCGVKRSFQSVEETTPSKKMKLEREACGDGSFNMSSVKMCGSLDVPNEGTPKKEIQETDLVNSCVKPEKLQVPVVQSRGSRMLDLIPESPKIKRFHDISLLKQPTVKTSNVVRNSRASKMLALLPEATSNLENIATEEPQGEKYPLARDECIGRGICGNASGKIHHLASASFSSILSESPRRSPLRQKKLIRFDDDRNEMVTYFIDSPPCLVKRSKDQRN